MRATRIRNKGEAVLIEYVQDGALQRAIVPRDSMVADNVDDDALERAISYGVAWEDLPAIVVTPDVLAYELRRRGIWTIEELQLNKDGALAAIRGAVKHVYAALLDAAQKEASNE